MGTRMSRKKKRKPKTSSQALTESSSPLKTSFNGLICWALFYKIESVLVGFLWLRYVFEYLRALWQNEIRVSESWKLNFEMFVVSRSPVCEEIICCRGDHVRLAVRVRVFTYPESACAVWIMFAVRLSVNFVNKIIYSCNIITIIVSQNTTFKTWKENEATIKGVTTEQGHV